MQLKTFENFINESTSIEINSYRELIDLIKEHTGVQIKLSNSTKSHPELSQQEIEEILRRNFRFIFTERNFIANNWTDEIREYENTIKDFVENTLMSDIKWFNFYHIVYYDRHGRLVVKENVEYERLKELKTLFFQMNKHKLSNQLKQDYIDYRKQYAGEDIKL